MGPGEEIFWLSRGADAFRVRCSGIGGAAIVMVHELGGTLHSWDRVAPALENDHRLVRYDARGAGLSSRIDGTVTLDSLVQDLAEVIDQCCPETRPVLMGTAVGAAVITAYLAQAPDRVRAAILTSPALDVAPARRAAVREAAARCRKTGFRAITESELAQSYPEALRQADPEGYALYHRRYQSNDAASFAAHLEMLSTLDLVPLLPTLDLPVLVLNGALDSLRLPARGDELASAFPRGHSRTLHSGHFMAWQTPVPFLDEVRAFLADLPALR